MALNPKKHEMPSQEPLVRAHNFNEVALGYTAEIAVEEARRCLNCKNRPCVEGCPVNIAIPDFIAKMKTGICCQYSFRVDHPVSKYWNRRHE